MTWPALPACAAFANSGRWVATSGLIWADLREKGRCLVACLDHWRLYSAPWRSKTEIPLENYHTTINPCLLPRLPSFDVMILEYWGDSAQMDMKTQAIAVRQSRLTSDAATSGHCVFRACIWVVFTARMDWIRISPFGSEGADQGQSFS